MTLHFSISELCIDEDAPLPLHVADKLLAFHIAPINPIRISLGVPVWASDRSGYRHKGWERSHNRAPNDPRTGRTQWSRHTFDPLAGKDPEGKGAVDWTTNPAYLPELGKKLLRESKYSRICWYPDQLFYHCDYGFEDRGKSVFINDGGWQQKSESEWLNIIA